MDDSDLNTKFQQIDGRFEQIDTRFQQIDTRFDKLEELIRSEGVTTRQHFGVVAEDLKSQVKLIAEGHSVLAEHMVDMKDGIERLEAGQGQLELRMLAVESQVQFLAAKR